MTARAFFRPTVHPVEILEPRIAPATVFNFTDADGDAVTVTVSAEVGATLQTAVDAGKALLTSRLTIPDVPAAEGLNIKITVKKAPGGDGLVAFGKIAATGVNLGEVRVKGDLAEIDAGDGPVGSVAVKLLKTVSMGVGGAAGIFGAGDLTSDLAGQLGKLVVAKDVDGARIRSAGATAADSVIGSAKIGGSLYGRSGLNSGKIEAARIGSVVIGGDIVGGDGVGSGSVIGFFGIGSLKVGGSVIGGFGTGSGRVLSDGPQTGGAFKIGGDVVGGSGELSGSIQTSDPIKSFKMGGSIIGGTSDGAGNVFVTVSGAVFVGGSIVGGKTTSGLLSSAGMLAVSLGTAPVTVGGDIIGGVAGGTGTLQDCGQLLISRVATTEKITVGGSIIAGLSANGAVVPGSGGVKVSDKVGTLVVKGDIIGNDSMQAFVSVLGGFVAGQAAGKIVVGGDMVQARITGGFGPPVPIGFFDQKLADVSFGTVLVKGDFRASNIAVGVEAGVNGQFGDADDAAVPGGTAFVSAIARVVIKGEAAGGGDPGDHFGIVAERVDAVQIGGRAIALGGGFDNIPLAVPGGNLSIRERAV